MKKILLTLAVTLVAAPAILRAEAAPVNVPVSSQVTVAGPVEELVKLMDKLFALVGTDGNVDDLTPAQMSQFFQIASDMEALKSKHASYKLTAADREVLVRWARSTNEKLTGEKMTASEIAELREELAAYKTFAELTEDLDIANL